MMGTTTYIKKEDILKKKGMTNWGKLKSMSDIEAERQAQMLKLEMQLEKKKNNCQ